MRFESTLKTFIELARIEHFHHKQLISVVPRLVFGRYLYDSMQIVDSHMSDVSTKGTPFEQVHSLSHGVFWQSVKHPPISRSVLGGESKSQMVRSVFGIAPTLWRPSPSSSGSIHEQQYLFMLTLVPFNDILIFVSTATRSGHYSLLRRGSRAGGYRRDVLQQLLPLFALSAGPGPHGRPQPLGTQREAHPGEIHPPSSALTPPGPTITAT